MPPGASSFPLHVHYANEELIVVLAGHPTLQPLEGERELEPGELVACPAGRRGAHRLENRSREPVRILIVSTMLAPELNEYPDSGKLWARTQVSRAQADLDRRPPAPGRSARRPPPPCEGSGGAR
ncbi:MAG TPA: cupin domain-containing protein [Solirubrobacteraceae bacterium]|nr:cupin domain-containing protein [Solirubrobacteraceae bacterium]